MNLQTFRVWAPKATRLETRLGKKNYEMSRDARDWWSVEIEGAKAGMDYSFVIDGGNPVPDPRSTCQPNGVHGASRLVDHSAFMWTDDAWQPPPLSAAIIYELHIGTFTTEGTFESAIERLEYLKQLGITHVEFMPVNEFSGDWGWGYDGVDLYAPHHSYGAPECLKKLVDACHKRGLACILDVVYNHFGPTGNYLSMFGPYFTDKYSTPWGEAVNLDGAGSVEVRRFLCGNAAMWLRDYHFDGLRLDAVHALVDTSAVHFLEQLSSEVSALEAASGRRKVLIAESDLNNPRIVQSREASGYGMDAQWSDDLHHALHAALTGEAIGYYEDFGETRQIAKALRDTFVYDGAYSNHRGRTHGRPAGNVSSKRFLGYYQTHDQVGNRAAGERFCQLAGFGKTKIAAAIVLTSPFVPMLFQGEEFVASSPFQYFTHHEEPGLARAVSEGRKREFAAFGWKPEDVPDPQDPETFRRSKLDWHELDREPHREMLAWYRELIRLRKSLPDLGRDRQPDMLVEYEDRWLHMRRGDVHLYCNLAAEGREQPLHEELTVLLSSDQAANTGTNCIYMPPESAMVLAGANANQRQYNNE